MKFCWKYFSQQKRNMGIKNSQQKIISTLRFSISDSLSHNWKKKPNLTVVIPGMTRSKELIEILHKCEIWTNYNGLLLCTPDAETSKSCPRDIAHWRPPIVMVNNNNFEIDTFTGNATDAHRTKVLCMLPKLYKKECNDD